MRARLAVACLWALATSACNPPVDARAVAAVRVLRKTEPPQGCRFVGMVEGKDTNRWKPGGLTYDAAVADLREKTVRTGANLAVIDSEMPPRQDDYPLPSFTVRSRIYACPALAPPSPAPPARACEPDCSPGYTCLRGTCVSACNPLCGPGERCGPDRICHPFPPAPPP